MGRKFFSITLSILLLNLLSLNTHAEESSVYIDCQTTSNSAPYGIKKLNIWLQSEKQVRVSFYDFYGLTDDFVRDERNLSDSAVFNVKELDVRKYPDGPVSPLKIDAKLMLLLQAKRATTPYAVALKSRRIVGQVRLLGYQLKEVVYNCRER